MQVVEALIKRGYKLFVVGGHIQFEYQGTGEPPTDACLLFNKLKTNKQEAIRYLMWNEETALNKLFGMNKRLNSLRWDKDFTFDGLKEIYPELYEQENELTNAIDECFKICDISELDKNISRYESLINKILKKWGARIG